MVLSQADRRLVAAVQNGLPLVSHPYAAVGAAAGMSEQEVIDRLAALQARGVIRRLGVVVRHHELGYRANAMVVWDVPDAYVEGVGQQLGAMDCVTLCYRRPRRPPRWPYNLFTMVHGRDRDAVLLSVDEMVEALGLADIPRAVLFSTRRFKQRGARYA